MPRGGPYACVNATDGTEIFRINGLMRETVGVVTQLWVTASSQASIHTTYKSTQWVKAQAKTTVTAPDTSVELRQICTNQRHSH